MIGRLCSCLWFIFTVPQFKSYRSATVKTNSTPYSSYLTPVSAKLFLQQLIFLPIVYRYNLKHSCCATHAATVTLSFLSARRFQELFMRALCWRAAKYRRKVVQATLCCWYRYYNKHIWVLASNVMIVQATPTVIQRLKGMFFSEWHPPNWWTRRRWSTKNKKTKTIFGYHRILMKKKTSRMVSRENIRVLPNKKSLFYNFLDPSMLEV